MPIESELLHKMQQLIFLSLCYTPQKYGQMKKSPSQHHNTKGCRSITLQQPYFYLDSHIFKCYNEN